MSNVPPPPGDLPKNTISSLLADPPWAAKSFLTAGATTVAGTGAWLSDLMSPVLASGGASFLGGFLIGWALRKTLTLTLLIAAALAALIAIMKSTGWIHIEWNLIHADLMRVLGWIQGKADGFKEVLSGYLPSAGAGGAGAYLGFRKK